MIRIGAVGAGMVFGRYQAAIDSREDMAITAVADTDAARRQAASRPGRRTCRTIEELLDQPVDAVLVLTCNSTHVETVKACLRRGVAILCEKPLATTADGARELVCLAQENNVFLFPAMHCRYRPEIRYVSDYCGKVAEFEHIWHEDWSAAPAWYRTPALSGGGVLLDVGINQMDWLSRLVGQMHASSAQINTADDGVDYDCSIDCLFSGGCGSMDLSWRRKLEQRHTRLIMAGGCTFELDHDARTVRENGQTRGPWNDDEYARMLCDFMTQLTQPETRDPGAGDAVVSLLTFIQGLYAGYKFNSTKTEVSR